MASHAEGPTNRLAEATSPYLLLHQHNPVDWYPWGEEAIAKARAEDKPIFLSVGYSTCYWCHVMERESFSDPETAGLLNRHFVSVKLDREERPDLDEIYMTATQLLTGHGGWPNSVFLTPKLEPFYAGTYFPPEPRHGMPSFRQLVQGLADAWEKRRSEVEMQAEEMQTAVRRFLEERGEPGMVPTTDVATRAVRALAQRFDARWGGFGSAPKFPSPANLHLLEAVAADDPEAARMLDATLDHMARGGIYDQLGGGFHRYATDREWKIPHFEKMLYDNGQLLMLYARAHARTGDPEPARVARETAAFLERELSDPAGGFWSAIDAETGGFEGAFYVWTRAQLESALEPEDAVFLAPIFGFDGAPFFEGEHYVLHLPAPLDERAAERRMSRAELLAQIAPSRERLLAARAERERPLTDDKVLTDWNGMAITGLAETGRLLGEPALTARAARAADFLLAELRPAGGPLHHAWRGGQLGEQTAFLSDYAFLIQGLLALHRADGEERWLRAAKELADEQDERLWDEGHGGYWVAAPAPDLLARSKEIFDGALPAANAVAAVNLVELYRVTGDERFRTRAADTLRAFAGVVQQQPDATRMLCLAILRYHRVLEEDPASGEDGVAAAGAAPTVPAGVETPVAVPAAPGDAAPVEVRLETGAAGDDGWRPFVVALAPAAGWHVYGPEIAAGVGLATTLEGAGAELRAVVWPPPAEHELAPGQPPVEVYDSEIEIRGETRATGDGPARLIVGFQPCSERSCLRPERVELELG